VNALRRLDPRGEYRMIATSDDYPANLATLAGIRDLRAYDVLISRADVSALAACGYDAATSSFPPSLTGPQQACLAASGVRWVISRDPAGNRRVGGNAFPGVGLYELSDARKPPPARDGPPRGFCAGAVISAGALLAGIVLVDRARRIRVAAG
jgi:hypothetical protein